jgi:endonuclease-3
LLECGGGSRILAEKRIKNKAKKIVKLLSDNYPGAKCSLNFSNLYELAVATILSAQCTDERVNKVTPAFFVKFPDFQSLSQGELEEIEKLIHSTGFYKNKAKSLLGLAKKVMSEYNGELPQVLSKLIKLPGIGRKTANVILGNGLGIAEGIVVDTHVKRLSNRLGLSMESNPEKIEKDLMEIIPENEWINFSHYLILHGRKLCKARKPNCSECFLQSECDFFKSEKK